MFVKYPILMSPTIVKPTRVTERIGSLDFLRGIAILGILFINIENFAYPDSFNPWKYGFHTPMDRDVRFWVYFLTQGKFATMFTLLFGVGFYMFLERLERKQLGLEAMDIYARRLLWLFIIGVFHAYFIWSGDVLYHYAICGLLLFPFRSFSQKALIIGLLVLSFVLMSNSYQKTSLRKISYHNYLEVKGLIESKRTNLENKRVNYWDNFLQPKKPDLDPVQAPKDTYLAGLKETYSKANVHKGMLYYQGFLFPTLMAMIMGIFLYRSGIFSDYSSWKHYWLITLFLLIVGLILNYYRYYHWTYGYFKPVLSAWKDIAFTFHKLILGVAYVLLLNGLYQKFLPYKNGFIIAVGKTALSNYILQNILLGFIFYGYGLAMFNRYSRLELIPIVVFIWGFQLILSYLWLKRFNMGPLEWFWRKMTYTYYKFKVN